VTRVAIYARVSTANGHQDPEMQLRELREFVERRGWQITGEYVDRGVSGSKDRRPALDQMMTAAQGRKFDVLLVWKLDRDLVHPRNSSLVLLLCVPWHLRLTAQPLLLVQLAQFLDFVAQLLNPDANFFQSWPRRKSSIQLLQE
jgi:resolvase-like protein